MSVMPAIFPLGLALIMAHVGSTLRVDDFRKLMHEPRAVAVGLFAQMVLLPALALGLCALTRLPQEIALGVVLIAAAPGGVTSNLITLIAGGDVALAVAITTLSTLAAVVTLPVLLAAASTLVGGALPAFAMPVGTMMQSLVLTTVLPLALGMAMRNAAPRRLERIEPWLRRGAIGIFGAMVVATFAGNAEAFIQHGPTLGPLMLMLNVAAMALAGALGRVAGLSRRQVIAVAVETGLQNAAVALVVALSVLDRPALAVAPVVYALVMNVVAAVFIPLARGVGRREGVGAAR